MAIQEIGDEFALTVGNEADRPAPSAGILYLAKDTKTPWICYDESDGWELLSPLKADENGILRFNGVQIIPHMSTQQGTATPPVTSATGIYYVEVLAGQAGPFLSALSFAPSPSTSSQRTCGLRLKDKNGTVIDEWTQTTNTNITTPGNILDRFKKRNANDVLEIGMWNWNPNTWMVATYTITSAYLGV